MVLEITLLQRVAFKQGNRRRILFQALAVLLSFLSMLSCFFLRLAQNGFDLFYFLKLIVKIFYFVRKHSPAVYHILYLIYLPPCSGIFRYYFFPSLYLR